MKILFILSLILISCAGVEPPEPQPPLYPYPTVYPDEPEIYCGDGICNGEETWRDCYDCLDEYNEPINGYCGDGFCSRHENRFSCWKDCRPRLINPKPEIGPGGAGPLPGPY